jgi:hypothetical protein
MGSDPGQPLRCKRCGSDQIRRASRENTFERLLSLAYIYPFRCIPCHHRFRKLRWGERWTRVGQERRRQERQPVDVWTTLFWQETQRQAHLRDLSPDGATVDADLPVSPGDSLELTLTTGDTEAPITVEVAVVRSVHSGRVGLQFVRVKSGDDERLKKFLQSQARP